MSGYLDRLAQVRNDSLLDGADIGIQMMMDYFAIALNDPEVMGKDTFGAARIKKVMRAVAKLHETFLPTLTKSAEADYLQETLDRRLREIFKDDFAPFEARYPLVKRIDYSKGKKEWR